MAIFNFHMSPIRRGAGKCLAAAAAYQRRSQIHDARTGITHNYIRKGGHLAGGLVGWDVNDLPGLIGALESAEKHPRAILGRSIDAALPHELPLEAHVRLVNGFGLWLRDRHGVAVQWDIHAPDKDGSPLNIHAHYLISSRVVTEGEVGAKTRELDVLPSGAGHITVWRKEWEHRVNRELERASIMARIDARSLAERAAGTGFQLEPMEHLGPERSRIERRGYRTLAGDRNRRRQEERRELYKSLSERGSVNRKIAAWKSITHAASNLQAASSLMRHDDIDLSINELLTQNSMSNRTAVAAEMIKMAVRRNGPNGPHILGQTVERNLSGLSRSDRRKIVQALSAAGRQVIPAARALKDFLSIFVENERER